MVSPFGIGTDLFTDSLLHNQSGAKKITAFDTVTFPVKIAGQVPVAQTSLNWVLENNSFLKLSTAQLENLKNFETRGYFRDRKLSFACLAAFEALTHSALDLKTEKPWISLGLGLEQAFLQDFIPLYSKEKKEIDWPRVESPTPQEKNSVLFRSEVDLSARVLAKLFDLETPCLVNSSACAAGTMAVAQAALWVERGMTDTVLCGASDSMVNPLGLGGMYKLGATSAHSTGEACKPFDLHRDGLLMGEGAAFFVVEEKTKALRRGGKILAEILGHGLTQDGSKVTAPLASGEMAALAMQKAIRRSNLDAAQVEYINAHGTGTPLNDPAEANAILKIFGDKKTRDLPVSSIKGAIGHLMAASGAIELASCLLPFSHDFLPGTKNFKTPDPACPLHVIPPVGMRKKIHYLLSNSFGFGGQNAAVLLGRGDHD